MDRDGTRGGYDLALTRAIADAVTMPVIASGGVGTLDDLVAGVTQGGASAVLAASIFHFGQHSIAEARAALARRAAGAALTAWFEQHRALRPPAKARRSDKLAEACAVETFSLRLDGSILLEANGQVANRIHS